MRPEAAKSTMNENRKAEEMGRTRGRRRRRAAALAAAAVALAIVVSSATAAEPTRDEYVARVEPICKANTEANRQIFKGAKGEVKAGDLKQASTHFARAATALEKTVKQLKAVPQPSADQAKLGKWLGFLEAEGLFLGKIGKALAAEQKAQAQTFSVRLNRNSNLANNTVLGFGFSYCRIDPSRFS
jgi:hypothetical protein